MAPRGDVDLSEQVRDTSVFQVRRLQEPGHFRALFRCYKRVTIQGYTWVRIKSSYPGALVSFPFPIAFSLGGTGSYKGPERVLVAQLITAQDIGPLDTHSTLLPTTRYIKAHSPGPIR